MIHVSNKRSPFVLLRVDIQVHFHKLKILFIDAFIYLFIIDITAFIQDLKVAYASISANL